MKKYIFLIIGCLGFMTVFTLNYFGYINKPQVVDTSSMCHVDNMKYMEDYTDEFKIGDYIFEIKSDWSGYDDYHIDANFSLEPVKYKISSLKAIEFCFTRKQNYTLEIDILKSESINKYMKTVYFEDPDYEEKAMREVRNIIIDYIVKEKL